MTEWMNGDQRLAHDAMVLLKKGGNIQTNHPFFSFLGLLQKYVQLKKPKRILEWGTGFSTYMMAIALPTSEIVTIEHDESWFRLWSMHLTENKNIEMHHSELNKNYVDLPLSLGKFDLVFVDGENTSRNECLKVAAQVLNVDGVAIVHDVEREEYWPSIREFFSVLETFDVGCKTVALELKKYE